MELFLVIGVLVVGVLVVAGIAVSYKFISDAKKLEEDRISKELELEELQREFLVRYAYNRKDSTPVDNDELTSMILQDIMQSDADVVMGTVTYDSNSKPTIHRV